MDGYPRLKLELDWLPADEYSATFRFAMATLVLQLVLLYPQLTGTTFWETAQQRQSER